MTRFLSKRSAALLMVSLPLAMFLSILLSAGQAFAQGYPPPPVPAGYEWRCVPVGELGQARAFYPGEGTPALYNPEFGNYLCPQPGTAPTLVPTPETPPPTAAPVQISDVYTTNANNQRTAVFTHNETIRLWAVVKNVTNSPQEAAVTFTVTPSPFTGPSPYTGNPILSQMASGLIPANDKSSFFVETTIPPNIPPGLYLVGGTVGSTTQSTSFAVVG